MGLFNRAKNVAEVERRLVKRAPVDCAATLVMPSGNRAGRLSDISEEGARFVTGNPPGKGCSAILEWSGHEAYCRVNWSNSEGCGLEFHRPIPRSVVMDTAARTPADGNRPLATERVPFGQKRSRPLC